MAKAYEDCAPRRLDVDAGTRMANAATFYEWAREFTSDKADEILAAQDQGVAAVAAARARYVMGLRALDYDWESIAALKRYRILVRTALDAEVHFVEATHLEQAKKIAIGLASGAAHWIVGGLARDGETE